MTRTRLLIIVAYLLSFAACLLAEGQLAATRMPRLVLFFLLIECVKFILGNEAALHRIITSHFLRCIFLRVVLIIAICPSVHRFRIIFFVKILGLWSVELPALMACSIANLLLYALYFVLMVAVARVQRLQIVPVGAWGPLFAASVHFLTILLGHTSQMRLFLVLLLVTPLGHATPLKVAGLGATTAFLASHRILLTWHKVATVSTANSLQIAPRLLHILIFVLWICSFM